MKDLVSEGFANVVKPYIDTKIAAVNQTLTNEVDTIVNDLSAKNLLDIETWLTSVGRTFTKNGDTYATSTGGQSYGTPFVFADKDIDVTLSGIITNDTSGDARVEILNSSNEMVARIRENTTYASGKGCKVRLNWSTDGNFSIEKPMIRPESIKDDTYVPYAMTNRELTEAVSIVTGTVTPITNTKATLDSTYTVLHKIGHMAILDFVLTVNSTDDWTVIGSIDLTPLSIARTIIPAQAGGSDAIKIQLNTSKEIRVAGGTVNKQYEGQLVFLTND